MRVQILSDLHLDFHRDQGVGFVRRLDPTNVDVLVLAGDLAEARWDYYGPRLREICAKYPHVVAVNGNHDLYGTTPDHVDALRKSFNQLVPNLHWLEDSLWVHPDTGHRFLGSVLWFRENPMAFGYEQRLADFKMIRGFKPWVYHANAKSRKFLASNIKPGDIVVTHHLPSQRSVDTKYKNSILNSFFVCEMDDVIDQTKPAAWVHGHSHTSQSYQAGDTMVVCNPLGYPGEVTSFKDKLVIELVGELNELQVCEEPCTKPT